MAANPDEGAPRPGKKRGRPKGSKNKPKNVTTAAGASGEATPAAKRNTGPIGVAAARAVKSTSKSNNPQGRPRANTDTDDLEVNSDDGYEQADRVDYGSADVPPEVYDEEGLAVPSSIVVMPGLGDKAEEELEDKPDFVKFKDIDWGEIDDSIDAHHIATHHTPFEGSWEEGTVKIPGAADMTILQIFLTLIIYVNCLRRNESISALSHPDPEAQPETWVWRSIACLSA